MEYPEVGVCNVLVIIVLMIQPVIIKTQAFLKTLANTPGVWNQEEAEATGPICARQEPIQMPPLILPLLLKANHLEEEPREGVGGEKRALEVANHQLLGASTTQMLHCKSENSRVMKKMAHFILKNSN